MGVVIVGGNECMVCQYEKICKQHGCKAKVFAKESGSFKKQVGNPGLMILFTNTVSHKMVKTAIWIPMMQLHSDARRWEQKNWKRQNLNRCFLHWQTD